MLRLILFVVDLFCVLPWWGAVGVLVGLVAALWAFGHYIVHRLRRELTETVLAQGTPLADALIEVHSVEPAAPPAQPSRIDIDEDIDEYDPGLDVDDESGTTSYYWVDATVAPHDPQAEWDPSALYVVQRDFEPEEELAFCEEMGLVHSLELQRNGEFVAQHPGNVVGPQRLRILFAVPHGLHNTKFAYHFTYFGSLTFPAPVALAHS
jgi:hypothetical protein